MKKKVNFQTTEYRNSGISILKYNLLKRYTCGLEQFRRAYKAVKLGLSLHSILGQPILVDIIKKEEIRMSILDKIYLPYKNVTLEQLKITRTSENAERVNRMLKAREKLAGKAMVLHFYSKSGDNALMAASYMVEGLLAQGLKGRVVTGGEINNISVDFTSDKENLLDKDFLCILAYNNILSTDFRDKYIETLFTEAKIKRIPIILASASEKEKELKINGIHIINGKFTDKVYTQDELLDINGF